MKRYAISFLTGIILLGFGCCYLVFEVMSFNRVALPQELKETKSNQYEYTLKENEIYNIINYRDHKTKLIIDNTLENQVRVKATYHNFYDGINVYKYLSQETVQGQLVYRIGFGLESKDALTSMKQMYQIVKQMVKNKEYYNELEDFTAPWLEISINEANLDQLEINDTAAELLISSKEPNKIAEF